MKKRRKGERRRYFYDPNVVTYKPNDSIPKAVWDRLSEHSKSCVMMKRKHKEVIRINTKEFYIANPRHERIQPKA